MKDLQDKVKQNGFVKAVDGSLGHKLSKFIENYGFLAGPYRPYVTLAQKGLNLLGFWVCIDTSWDFIYIYKRFLFICYSLATIVGERNTHYKTIIPEKLISFIVLYIHSEL